MEVKNNMTLHTKLVSLRKQNGFTQLELAERLNVSRQAVSRWESGAAVPTIDNLKVLSNLYCVSLDSLLNNEEEPCKKTEGQKPEQQAQNYNEQCVKRKKHIIIGSIAIILVILISVIIGIRNVNKSDQEQITPIEEMDTAIEDDYSEGTFSFN